MKLLVPPLNIDENKGFTDENDIFKRKPFAQKLTNLVKNTDDEFVLAIDAPWGEGKTTFIKMWKGLLDEEGVACILFDAFENDYQQDPFLAIAREIYALIDDESDQSDLKEKSIAAFNTFAKIRFIRQMRPCDFRALKGFSTSEIPSLDIHRLLYESF